jgi:exodeoxyribonuclease V gamma subunit
VEVLREAILGLMAADLTLEPRDVLVMCPDVETFAPLVAAAFSLGAPGDRDGAPHPAAALRVRLADRALRQVNPLLDVLAKILTLGASRVTASEVLDLAGHTCVRRRFGFADDEVERLRSWVAGTGVRWGLDGGHRGDWRLGGVSHGTWRAGLDRLLLGVATAPAAATAANPDAATPPDLAGVLPFDDVDSAEIDLAGRLAELVDRIGAARELLAGRHTVAAWTAGLEAAVLSLAATPPRDAWQRIQLHGELADVAEAAAGSDVRLGLADVRALLEPALAGRPTRTGFRTGTLTVCTLVPMRSVPHRVVCLLGLDDGTFPRQTVRDGEDVLARDPWVGERDPRSEDRQLLLDAVCAAQEHLVVTYSGADERTGVTIPPAVPLGELLDALDRTATTPDGRPARDAVTVRHPLQPFDARNFTPDTLGVPGPFSFDSQALEGARSAAAPRGPAPRFLPAPLPAAPREDVELADLHHLLRHPARGFLRRRLQVAAGRPDDEPADDLKPELTPLEQWPVGERLLAMRLAGIPPADCLALEERRGLLPPGRLGIAVAQTVGGKAEAVVAASAAERTSPPESHDVDVALPDGTRLTGTVGNVRGDVVLTTTYSQLSPRHRLTAWVDVVALTAARPDRPWRAVAVGRAKQGALHSTLGPLTRDDALATVAELVALYRIGLRAPLPLALKTGAAYALRRSQQHRVPAARTAAEAEWLEKQLGNQRRRGEREDPEHVLVHGPDAPFAVLLAETPGDDEAGDGWAMDEDERFGRLARRLWTRLLAAERQVSR